MRAQQAVPTGPTPTASVPSPAQAPVGPPPAPTTIVPLTAPTMRPDEPVTAGSPSGPGPGPDGTFGAQPADEVGQVLRDLYRRFPYPGIRELIEDHDGA